MDNQTEQRSFKQIGKGFVHTSAKGTKSIRLSLDPQAFDGMNQEDFTGKIFIRRTDRLDKNGQPTYSVSAPMPEEYQNYTGFNKASNINTQESKIL